MASFAPGISPATMAPVAASLSRLAVRSTRWQDSWPVWRTAAGSIFSGTRPLRYCFSLALKLPVFGVSFASGRTGPVGFASGEAGAAEASAGSGTDEEAGGFGFAASASPLPSPPELHAVRVRAAASSTAAAVERRYISGAPVLRAG
ncbi:hypothetical protein [Streptomyces vinaceus]|uniref:hypothetical protein n=1 Tax=Streptomyces vinaceus TaxID=1960 RepID=UPI00367F26CD